MSDRPKTLRDRHTLGATEQWIVDAMPAESRTSHAWDDPERWEHGPPPPEDEPFEPEPADREWWAEQSLRPIAPEPTDLERDEHARRSE
jgi:hypothetical protein